MSALKEFLEQIGFGCYLGEFHAAKIDDLDSLRFVAKQPRMLAKIVEIERHRTKLLGKLRELESGNVPLTEEETELDTQEVVPSSQPLLDRISVEEEETGVEESGLEVVERPGTPKSPPCKRPHTNTELDLKFENNADWKYLKALYALKGFDNKARVRLAELIIKSEYNGQTNTVITAARFKSLAKLIVNTFEGEVEDSYYVPAFTPKGGKTVISKGKLYDRYTVFNKELRETGQRNLRPGQVYVETDCVHLPLPVGNQGTIEASLKFLQRNLHPWEAVRHHWGVTSNHRLNALYSDEANAKLEVDGYFKEYPCLTLAAGYTLLESDFDNKFADCRMRIYSHWEQFSQKVNEELKKQGLSSDGDVDLLQKFVNLFTTVVVKTNKKPWRANRVDISKGFVHLIPASRDLDKELKDINAQAIEKGVTVQPFPILIGQPSEIESSYVILNEKAVKVENPLRAFEIAFKCIFALNAKYQAQSERPWLVVQKTLFNLHRPEDRVNVSANLPEVRRLVKVLQC